MPGPNDDALPELFTGAHARGLGWTRHQVEWAVRSGRWRALRRGIYTVAARYDELDALGRHLVDCRAALRVHDERHVLSHLSAAISFGLPCPLEGPGRPTLTIGAPGASTDRQDDLVVQVASLRDRDAVRWDRGRRTAPARTVADCLRHVATPDAVAIADSAVRRGLTDLARIEEVLRWQEGWPYLDRGREALPLIDPRRESWLESFSFTVLRQLGIPLPVSQVAIYDAKGRFIGRVDAYWPDRATVGEADGRAKYAIAEPAAATATATATESASVSAGEELAEVARRAVIREKEREDRLRDTGLEMVRWSTPEIVRRPLVVAERVQLAWRRGDPARFSGKARAVDLPAPLAVETGSVHLPDTG